MDYEKKAIFIAHLARVTLMSRLDVERILLNHSIEDMAEWTDRQAKAAGVSPLFLSVCKLMQLHSINQKKSDHATRPVNLA